MKDYLRLLSILLSLSSDPEESVLFFQVNDQIIPMKTPLLFLIAWAVSAQQSFSQDIAFMYPMSVHTSEKSRLYSFPVYNPENQESAIFIQEDKQTQALLLSPANELIKEFTIGSPGRDFSQLLGAFAEGRSYSLFLVNRNPSKVKLITTDFEQETHTSQDLALPLVNQSIIGATHFRNQLILLTYTLLTSKLHKYTIQADGSWKVHTFLINKTPYHKSENLHFSRLLRLRRGRIPLIRNDGITSIREASERIKLYVRPDKFILTGEQKGGRVSLFEIELESDSLSYHEYRYLVNNCPPPQKVIYNSFLLGDRLFQVRLCTDQFAFSVLDTKADTFIISHKTLTEADIPFQNSPLLQVGGNGGHRQQIIQKIKTPKSFFTKMFRGHIGIIAHEHPQGIEVTFGGYRRFKSTMPLPGIPLANGVGLQLWLNSYNGARTVYMKGLFNETDISHKQEALKLNTYEKIRKTLFMTRSREESLSLLQKGKESYLGYYDPVAKAYFLFRH